MQRSKLIIALIIAVLILLLVFQNLESCTTRFLFFSITLPRALMLFIALAAGFIVGLLVATMRGKHKAT